MKYMLLLTRGEWQESGSDEEKGAVFAEIRYHFTRVNFVATGSY